jgi:hypothetical protein
MSNLNMRKGGEMLKRLFARLLRAVRESRGYVNTGSYQIPDGRTGHEGEMVWVHTHH